MKEQANISLDQYLETQRAKRRDYRERRKKTRVMVGVELTPYAAHVLHVLAKDRGVGRGAVLSKMLEFEGQRKDIELPPPVPEPASQVVTKEIKEQPKIDLQKTLDAWDED